MRNTTTDFNAIFGVRKRRPDVYRRFRKAVASDDRIGVDELTDDDVGEIGVAIPPGSTHVDGLANLICEANPAVDRATALYFLLHTADGAALVARTQRTTKKETTMNRVEELKDIVKSGGGIENFAKMLIDSPQHGGKVSEAEFTALVTDEARKAHPTLKADRAFAKYFEENATIRKAHAIITTQPANQRSYLASEKAAPYATLTPRVSGGADAQDVNNATDAMDKINALVAELRSASPELTSAQAFARVYCDPNNHALAEAERRQNRPRVA